MNRTHLSGLLTAITAFLLAFGIVLGNNMTVLFQGAMLIGAVAIVHLLIQIRAEHRAERRRSKVGMGAPAGA